MRILILISFLLISGQQLKAQTNRALLIAIDSYPESSGWMPIHANNDIDLLLPLLKKNKFKTQDIIILRNEEATRRAIDKALIDLEDKTEKGDFVFIHFSCHGQQMLDDNGDEPDGLDEALIPYDAERRFKAGHYEGERHLRDDVLQVSLEQIRLKAGREGELFVMLDACHSGTATREGNDDDYVRGTSYIFAPEGHEPLSTKESRRFVLSHKQEEQRADIMVVSACQPDEVNYEYKSSKRKYYGRLTYTFCNVMKESPGGIKNKDFAERLNARMSLLSTGRRIKQTPYFETTNNEKEFRFGL